MWLIIVLVVLAVLFLFWADGRTRGRGTNDSGGAGDQKIPYPPM